MLPPVFDERDAQILAVRRLAFDSVEGPRVGDFVIMPNGSYERFSHDWGKDLQTTAGGSFYLYGPEVDFSGTLNPPIQRNRLQETDETREGDFWFFHHGSVQAHNGVHFKMPCRVFRCTPDRC